MRFTYLELENYIGIYNGMGLDHIIVDMSKTMYRTLIIRGENGSGKSTILEALSVFPDRNEMFIPKKPAKKVVCLLDHDVYYTIQFFHGVKNNGDRETTKAFISKTINGSNVELNENGNVTSFKDILYNELSLDSNFVALSQLSMDDKGLADKKPAERKRFVNSIIESLEVYNDIYKVFTKKSTNIKAMIDSLVAKLGSIGDLNVLTQSLKSIEDDINSLNTQKDIATKELMRIDATINLLDPNSSIQSRYSSLSLEIEAVNRDVRQRMKKLNYFMPAGPLVSLEQAKIDRDTLTKELDTLMTSRVQLEQSITQLLSYISDINSQIKTKEIKRDNLANDDNYQIAMDKYVIYSNEVDDYRNQMSVTGIDPNLFTKDEYIMALETLKDIQLSIASFKDKYDYNTVERVITAFRDARWPNMIPLISLDEYQDAIDEFESKGPTFSECVFEAELDIDALKALDKRPSSCADNSCYFISNLLALQKSNPQERYDRYTGLLNELKTRYDMAIKEKERAEAYNSCSNQIRILLREIDKNGAILSKLPNGGIFTSKAEFFERILHGEDFSYFSKIYSYINFANIVDLYHTSYNLMQEYQNKCDLYASKYDILEEMDSEISNLKEKQCSYTDNYNEMNNKLSSVKDRIVYINNAVVDINHIIDELSIIANGVQKIENDRVSLNDMQESIQKINESVGHYKYLSDQIQDLTNRIAPKMKTRDGINYSIHQAEEYNKELEELKKQYDVIETIKHYSSPTKGIQLVFMELYMGKILSIANELLSLLFNGEYSIQPFIINESEFRIPCLGGGYINDDISSMSSAQISMISMILSFSLLYTSSTKYNIIKIDEIDAPLDENNRIMFIDVMNRIMDIMHVEQCIMISHNTELQVDASDVILLKSKQLSADYTRGNIIWKY